MTSRAELSQSELEHLVADILAEARRLGASQAEAGVNIESGLTVTVRMGDVETLEYQRDRGLGVTVYMGKRKGNASTADLSPQAMRETVAAACNIARHTAEDEFTGLADAELMAEHVPDLDLCHPWDLTAEAAIDIAKTCEDAARNYDARIENSDASTVTSHRGLRVYGNSHGFVGGYEHTGHSISCSVVGREGGSMQRDYWYTAARAPVDLDEPVNVGRLAGERTVNRLNSRQLKTCKAPVLYAPEVAKGIIGHFLGAVRGGSQYRKTSFLLQAAGTTVFPDFVRICERPHIKRGMGSTAFDSEGVATKDRELVLDGVLQGYVLSSYSARKLGMHTTGNAGGVHNLIVEPGEKGADELVKDMNKGLLVTELMGQGVNPVTGDYSRGAAGFWIENGEVAYPVEEITVAGNLRDMYLGIQAVGNDVDVRGNIRTGSILIDSMTIAGK
ncbi:MAG: metalloprotease PmbA [Gammaproteobacteria bacterium]|nr:metalloprotease PmbA [Gammaproteobacteria bacterium]